MLHIEKSIEVEVPLRTAYNQATEFEDFPRFMDEIQFAIAKSSLIKRLS